MKPVGIGVIGCGVISTAYLTATKQFPILESSRCRTPSRRPPRRAARNSACPACGSTQMLPTRDIEIVVNLTVPLAHTDVSLAVLNAGKHVHSEKPLGVNLAEARKVMDLAAAKNLRVGCAPDTFLGGGHQTARKLIDDGAIGTPVGGTRLLHVPRATNAGIRRPASIICAAAGRCSTWALITSPTSCSCSARSASVMGVRPRGRGSERLITSEPLNGTLHSGRGLDPCHRHARIRERRGGVRSP